MPASLEGKLVVAISSRAVFDFEEENRVFERGDDDAYMAMQRERVDTPARPGVAYALVRKLLEFDPPGTTAEGRRIEVVVLSRNDPFSGLRVFRSAQQSGLRLERGVFTRGRSPHPYLGPLKANLFLSTNDADVREAVAAGFPAARVFPQSVSASESHPNEIRIAFDGDAVLFSDESEMVFQRDGLDQGVVAAIFNNLSLFKHDQAVEMCDRRQAVCDGDDGFTCHQCEQMILNGWNQTS